MDALQTARELLPGALSAALDRIPDAEEIRLRVGRAPTVVIAGRETVLCDSNVDRPLILRILEKATGASLHAAAPALRNGYVVYKGLRIGVCGEAVNAGSDAQGLRGFSSLAIRVPHAIPGDCGALIDSLLRFQPAGVLIAAPPGVGKTSFLRELIRRAADRPMRVAVIDERNELAASVAGVAQFELGRCSDVMIGVPKARASMMLLRGMNPQIIAMDEITQEEDALAIENIVGCGVTIFATLHGRDRKDLEKRPLNRRILASGAFQQLVLIRRNGGRRSYTMEELV